MTKQTVYATVIKKYTYFMGMRVTTNNAQTTLNSDPSKIEVLPQYRTNVFNKPTDSFDPTTINISSPINNSDFQYQSSGGYRNQGGFV
jgi:hypothetical protein